MESKFSKNNLNVIPHPRRTFDILQPMLYFYVELNNLSFSEDKKNDYYFEYFVTNQSSDTVKTGIPKTAEIVGKNQAEIGSFNALSLPEGVYFLNIRARDNSSKTTSNIRKKFFVNKPQKAAARVEEIQPEIDPIFRAMTKEEIDHEVDITRYIADRNEQDIFDQLDSLSAIKKFLTSFWGRRDKNSGRAIGESRRVHLELINEANNRFGNSNDNGWETDRGRILTTYGHPDEIDRHPSSDNSKPYSVWKYYQLEGGNEFIFYDRTGFGNYELVHSSYYKEIQNPNWESVILETLR